MLRSKLAALGEWRDDLLLRMYVLRDVRKRGAQRAMPELRRQFDAAADPRDRAAWQVSRF
jgi:hypothetical protein